MKPIHFESEGEYSKAEFLNLIEKIGEFRNEKPYERIGGDYAIGIRQKNGETLWCSVMGEAGMEFGVSVFYGFDSFNAFYDFAETQNMADVAPMRKMNSCYFNLHNKTELETCDKNLYKELGFTGFGRGKGWPYIRRYLPGHVPTEHLSRRDVASLTFVLTHLASLLDSIESNEIKWDDSRGYEQWPIATISESGEISWEYIGSEDEITIEKPIVIDPFMKKRLLKLPRKGIDGIFVGSPILFIPIAEVNPPVLSEMMFFIDASNGMVLDHAVLTPADASFDEQRVKRVCAFLADRGERPENFFFDNTLLAESFSGVFDDCSTIVDHIEAPEAYHEMLTEMSMMMNRR